MFFTNQKKYDIINTSINFGGNNMAHVITNECVACGACESTCPVEAIVFNEAKGVYEINPDVCVDCGACKDGCPVEAIKEN